jgi:hypothetical protein
LGAALRAGFFAARDTARRAGLSAAARRAEAEAPLARRRGRAAFRAAALRAGFAALRREAVFRAEALRVVPFGLLRPAFRLAAFALRFAITDVLS